MPVYQHDPKDDKILYQAVVANPAQHYDLPYQELKATLYKVQNLYLYHRFQLYCFWNEIQFAHALQESDD